MKPQIIGRIIAAALLGILMGIWVHHTHIKGEQLGREKFLAKQAVRFDKFYADPPPIILETFASVIMTGFGFSIYELVAWGVSKCFKKTDADNA